MRYSNLLLTLIFIVAFGFCSVALASEDETLSDAYEMLVTDHRDPDSINRVLNVTYGLPKSEKTVAFREFILNRSIHNGLIFLQKANSSDSLALAYQCLGEAHYAHNQPSKAILYGVLSMAWKPTKIREQQLKQYITDDKFAELSLSGSKADVLNTLNSAMGETISPKLLRRYFTAATLIGLLGSYPLLDKEKQYNDPIEIVMAFDKNFAPHGAVTLISAMMSAAPTSQYNFHIMEDITNPLGDNFKIRIKELVKGH